MGNTESMKKHPSALKFLVELSLVCSRDEEVAHEVSVRANGVGRGIMSGYLRSVAETYERRPALVDSMSGCKTVYSAHREQ
jgi:hypothetical protein